MPAVLIDGGGSTTRIGVSAHSGVVWEQVGSLHHEASDQAGTWDRLLKVIGDAAGPAPLIVLAGLSIVMDQRSAECVSDRFEHVVSRMKGSATLVTSNDITPLLLANPNCTVVAAIAGTGTGFASRTPNGTIRRASGAEYLLSDEGGGFDIGLQGLRAVIKAADGRGPATELTTAALALGGGTLEGLREHVYAGHGQARSTKQRIAAFARAVLQTAGTDEVAAAIVHAAAHELAAGVIAVSPRTGSADAILVLSGSLLGREDGAPLRERTLAEIVGAGASFGDVEVVVDSREHAVRCVGELIAGRLDLNGMLDPTGNLPVAVRTIGHGGLGRSQNEPR